ncbi:MAG: class II aldolase/adducin family protein [Oscillospiraceae bacterium]|jgi:L-fuculose-phosphate aldolase|nr:class II aldolase/adducin family protein [Oscillospiraceae bacterium]
MDILQAKQLVVDAGKKLVETGLIARTWGNVSCRISDTQFVITPSGKAYEAITPDDIVTVNIADCSYESDIKPSSEKGVHAAVYQLKPDMNFVIHTHQPFASAVSALGFDVNNIAGESRDIIGDHVPCAAYGMPSTGKLKKGVRAALARSDSKAVLMAYHGALCMGVDYEDTFAVAAELEKVCEGYILSKYQAVTGSIAEGFRSVGEYIASLAERGREIGTFPPYDSVREGSSMRLVPKDGGEEMILDIAPGKASLTRRDEPVAAELHRAVYKKRGDVSSIIHANSDAIVSASRLGVTIKPLLDDLAQIAGATVRSAEFDPSNTMKTAKKTVKKLRGRNAVMLKNNGAICVAKDEEEAGAVELVLEKGTKTYLTASLFEKINPINAIETRIMRFVYLQKYSKQK